MFRDVIRATPFSTEAAGSVLGNISGFIWGNTPQGDVTFLSTLRALLGKKIDSNEEKVTYIFIDKNIDHVYTTNEFNRLRDQMYSANETTGTIEVINSAIAPDSSKKDEVMNSIKGFMGNIEGFKCVPKVTDFFRKSFDVLCFINEERKNVSIFTWGLSLRSLHFLQCAITVFLPWYFQDADSISEKEKELIMSLTEKTPDHYMSLLEEFAAEYDFRTLAIKKMLDGFEASAEQERLQSVKNDIEYTINQINQYNNEIGNLLRNKNDLETTLLGLEAKIAMNDGSSEIMDYFLCNKKLNLISREGQSITFTVKSYLEYFNEEEAETIINNEHGYAYRDRGSIISHAEMKKLLTAIFLDQVLKIKFCAAYAFNINANVRGLDGYNFGLNGATPNPHVNNYRCLGNYVRIINELLLKRNYVAALEQCVASCNSLNLMDTPVMETFMRTMYMRDNDTYDKHFIELPDGKMVTPKEAVDWLKSKEENNEQNN